MTIRDLDDALKHKLRMRAASRNRSMEEEVRQILRSALSETPGSDLDIASRIRARFAGLGDTELPVPERDAVRAPPDLGGRKVARGRTAAAKGLKTRRGK